MRRTLCRDRRSCERSRGQRLEDIQLGRGHDQARRHDPKPTLHDARRRDAQPECKLLRQVLGNDAKFHDREPSRTLRAEIETRRLFTLTASNPPKAQQAHGPLGPWACISSRNAKRNYFSLTTNSTGFAVARFAGV